MNPLYIVIITTFIIILILSIILLLIHFIRNNEKFKILKSLCNLDKEKLDLYYESYGKIFNDQKMISTLDDYENKREPAKFIISEDTKESEYTANCYNILSDLCSLGNVKKMYIPRLVNSNKSLIENQVLYENEIAKKMNLSPNGKILEIGCGCGRIAYNISLITGCQVIGINIDMKQINDAIEFSKNNNSKNKFIYHDLNDIMPFNDNTFDSIYSFGGCLSFINQHTSFFSEIFRILKPNCNFILSDGVLLDNFNRENANHLKLMVNSRMVMAGGVFLHYKYYEDMAKDSGFETIFSRGGDSPTLAQELSLLESEHANFERIQNIIYFLVSCKIIPEHMYDLILRLRLGGEDLIEMEKNNLLTMTWEFCFKKPEYLNEKIFTEKYLNKSVLDELDDIYSNNSEISNSDRNEEIKSNNSEEVYFDSNLEEIYSDSNSEINNDIETNEENNQQLNENNNSEINNDIETNEENKYNLKN